MTTRPIALRDEFGLSIRVCIASNLMQFEVDFIAGVCYCELQPLEREFVMSKKSTLSIIAGIVTCLQAPECTDVKKKVKK